MLEFLLHWAVFSVVFPLLIGVGASVMSMSPPEFTIAKWCFSVAASIAAARLGWWMAIEQTEETYGIKAALIAFLLFGCIGALWTGAMRWVSNRQRASLSSRAQRVVALEQQLTARTAHQRPREVLSHFIECGSSIRAQYQSPDPVPETPAREWMERVRTYLEDVLDASYALRWEDTSGLPLGFSLRADTLQSNREIYVDLYYRIARLREFMKELGDEGTSL